MLIGDRCQEMLPNSMQCPNAAVEGSDFCLLHNQLKAAKVADETNQNTTTNINNEPNKIK